jgi:GNAT superfamily N-acetyltransferase
MNFRDNQIPHVQKILAQGYSIESEPHPEDPRLLLFWVAHSGRPAASACFWFDRETRRQRTEHICVYPGHQRKGIATALMLCAMSLTGCSPIPGAGQTEEGAAWWNQPRRPW